MLMPLDITHLPNDQMTLVPQHDSVYHPTTKTAGWALKLTIHRGLLP